MADQYDALFLLASTKSVANVKDSFMLLSQKALGAVSSSQPSSASSSPRGLSNIHSFFSHSQIRCHPAQFQGRPWMICQLLS